MDASPKTWKESCRRDSLPLVGCVPDAPHCYIASGYTGHGNAYAIQCAQILSALVQRQSHAYANLFDPARFASSPW